MLRRCRRQRNNINRHPFKPHIYWVGFGENIMLYNVTELEDTTTTPQLYYLMSRFIMHGTRCQLLTALLIICIVFVKITDSMSYFSAHHDYSTDQLDTFVMRDVYDCLSHDTDDMVLSMRDKILVMGTCIHRYISHCTKRRNIDKHTLENDVKHTYCAMIAKESTSSHFSTLDTYFAGIKGYLMYFNILIFDFEWSYLWCNKHGLSITSSPEAAQLCFRGNRLPWKIVVEAHYALMRLRSVSPFKLTLFYSLNKLNWLIDFSKQQHIYLSKTIPLNIQSLLSKHVFNINVYSLYVRCHPMNRIAFIIQEHQPIADIALYDGPGIRSQRLYQYKNYRNTFFTSGFLGYVRFVEKQNNDLNFVISLQVRPRRGTIASCFKLGRALPITILAYVPENKGQICFHIFEPFKAYLRLNIKYFVYNGNCEYGGFFIGQLTMTGICENRSNFIIYGESLHFTMLLVWYSGYSYGSIEAELQDEHCITKYLNRINYLKYNKIMIKENSIHCQRVLCILANTADTPKCKFHIKGSNKPIGVTRIKMDVFHASRHCQHNAHNMEHNVSALHSEDWPLMEPILSHYISTNKSMIYEYKYLNDVNISLRYTCDHKKPLPQYGIILQTSTCYLTRYDKMQAFKYVLDTIEITANCFYRSIPVGDPTKVRDLLYTVEGNKKMYSRLQIRFLHRDCTNQVHSCDNYKYILAVKQHNIVTRYFGDIGFDENFAVFPAYYHHGFNLSIIQPGNPCNCTLEALFLDHKFHVGTHNGTSFVHGRHEWHIYSRRFLFNFAYTIYWTSCRSTQNFDSSYE